MTRARELNWNPEPGMSSGGGTEQALLGGVGGERKEEKWWDKVLDMAEAKHQFVLALPMVLTNVFYYLIPLISVMIAGHLGQLQLASSTLANSWATVTGFAFMLGLSGALETLCGQGFGAQLYKMLGIYLQASCIISFIFCLIISIIWWYTEPILLLLHQNPDISKEAAVYMRYLIPGIFAFGTLQNILRFLQTQSVVMPLMICSLIPLLPYWFYIRTGSLHNAWVQGSSIGNLNHILGITCNVVDLCAQSSEV